MRGRDGSPPATPAPVAAPGPAVAAQGGIEPCPVCGEARPGPFARFCDTCRYDFLAKQPFSPVPLPQAPPKPAVPVALPTVLRWDLHASVDPSLRRAEDPVPTDMRGRVFPLDLADHLIGRRSDSADIHPEIVINDPGISRRHARILHGADGALVVLDLGSMNGTWLNDAPLEPNVPAGIAAGDQITLGCWTRLRLVAR